MSNRELNINDLVADLDFDLNAGDPLSRRALYKAARDMQSEMPIPFELSMAAEDGVGLYDYSNQIPEGFVVECIECVEYCGTCIDPIEKCDPCPKGYEMCDMGLTQIQIHPFHVGNDPEQTIDIRVHLKAKFDGGVIPEYFCRFADVLLDKARANLAEMPGREWTNPGYAREMRDRAAACQVSNTVRQSRSGSAQQQHATGDPII